MNNWLITNKINPKTSLSNSISLINNYKFIYDALPENSYYEKDSNSGIFIFGYYAIRLNRSSENFSLPKIFEELKNNPLEISNIIKGIFTVILIDRGKFYIYNDALGMSKYFYSFTGPNHLISNRIQPILDNIKTSLSNKNILRYYLFNYNLNGHTFYNEIKYATPASVLYLDENNNWKQDIHFDILSTIARSTKTLTKKEVFNRVSELYLSIIKQWKATVNSNHVSLTLTAGLDSRILLGSLRKTNFSAFNTFTFGHKKSVDVIYAKKIARRLNLNHIHYYPNKDFFENFYLNAEEVFKKGDTLVSIYRAHRLDAYKKISEQSKYIFMGLAGSDLVRGLLRNGLIVNPVAAHCWENNSFQSYFDNESIQGHLKNLGFDKWQFILDEEKDYWYFNHPIHYLFKVVIPLHFSQDISMNYNVGLQTILPFLDLDYLEFLPKTGYFSIDQYKNYGRYDFKKRAEGLYYSAGLVNSIDKELAGLSVGKGYSPRDILNSMQLTFVKDKIFKIRYKNKFKVNFSYNKWYWQYLYNYIETNDWNNTGLNKSYLLNKLEKKSPHGGELHFLDFTKAVNIHLATAIQ